MNMNCLLKHASLSLPCKGWVNIEWLRYGGGIFAVKNVVIDKTVSVPDEYEFVTGGLFRSTILFYYM